MSNYYMSTEEFDKKYETFRIFYDCVRERIIQLAESMNIYPKDLFLYSDGKTFGVDAQELDKYVNNFNISINKDLTVSKKSRFYKAFKEYINSIEDYYIKINKPSPFMYATRGPWGYKTFRTGGKTYVETEGELDEAYFTPISSYHYHSTLGALEDRVKNNS